MADISMKLFRIFAIRNKQEPEYKKNMNSQFTPRVSDIIT